MLGLVLLNGVFAGAEIGILSVRKTRLRELVDGGSRAARVVLTMREQPERFLATVQVGITVVSATAAAFGGSSIATRLVPLLEPLAGAAAYEVALALVVVGVSFLSIVLGELVPKSLALRGAEPYALLIGPPLAALAVLARPAVWFLTACSNAVLRLFGDQTSFTETRLSSDEIQQLVDEAASAGTVDRSVGDIASRAFDFLTLDAATVMVPRPEIVAVARGASLDELAETALRTGHSRVLVHDGELENVVGYVNVREVLARARREPELTVAGCLRAVPFVAETMPAPALLRDLQRRQQQLAVVVDEQGTVRGLVTVEDLVEELVGELMSEGDRTPEGMRREEDGAVVVTGATPIHELNRALSLELPESESFSTIAGLCIETSGRIPSVGDTFRLGEVEIEIIEATHRRVKSVRLRPILR